MWAETKSTFNTTDIHTHRYHQGIYIYLHPFTRNLWHFFKWQCRCVKCTSTCCIATHLGDSATSQHNVQDACSCNNLIQLQSALLYRTIHICRTTACCSDWWHLLLCHLSVSLWAPCNISTHSTSVTSVPQTTYSWQQTDAAIMPCVPRNLIIRALDDITVWDKLSFPAKTIPNTAPVMHPLHCTQSGQDIQKYMVTCIMHVNFLFHMP
jgi:hypothetical protein